MTRAITKSRMYKTICFLVLLFAPSVQAVETRYPHCECAGPLDSDVLACSPGSYALTFSNGVCKALAFYDSSQPDCDFYKVLTTEELAFFGYPIRTETDVNR